jgi:hypothetical protein
MSDENESYIFPWGFHLGDLTKGRESIPLYTNSNDGGFCLLYDKASEKKSDTLLESLCLELLSSMPQESLKVDMFDFGKKKFYHLSPLGAMQLYKVSYTKEMIGESFEALEETIVSRHTDLLCCNRKTIDEHNQKSKMRQGYHLVLINLANFPTEEIELRRIQNFIESAQQAGVYIIAFGYQELLQSENKTTQAMLKGFKNIKVSNGEFEITSDIFEFMELLDDHSFEPLALNKQGLLQEVLQKADLEKFMDPEAIKLEENTRV